MALPFFRRRAASPGTLEVERYRESAMKLRVEQPEKWSELVEVAGTALHSAGRYGVDDALRADPDFAVAMVLAGAARRSGHVPP